MFALIFCGSPMRAAAQDVEWRAAAGVAHHSADRFSSGPVASAGVGVYAPAQWLGLRLDGFLQRTRVVYRGILPDEDPEEADPRVIDQGDHPASALVLSVAARQIGPAPFQLSAFLGAGVTRLPEHGDGEYLTTAGPAGGLGLFGAIGAWRWHAELTVMTGSQRLGNDVVAPIVVGLRW